MSEILKAINVEYTGTNVHFESESLRIFPFDDPEVHTSTYQIDLVSPEDFGIEYVDHPVCISCPLYTPESELLQKTDKSVECTGPFVFGKKDEEGMHHMQGTIHIHEFAQGTIYGNCGVVVDTQRNVKDRVYPRK